MCLFVISTWKESSIDNCWHGTFETGECCNGFIGLLHYWFLCCGVFVLLQKCHEMIISPNSLDNFIPGIPHYLSLKQFELIFERPARLSIIYRLHLIVILMTIFGGPSKSVSVFKILLCWGYTFRVIRYRKELYFNENLVCYLIRISRKCQ